MDCPGEYLKRERELRDVSLDDISREIKVPIKLLRALEADDYKSLPHTAFVKGFIRAYCKYLGVDENDALLRYELYLQEIAEFEVPPKDEIKPLDVQERSYPVRKYLTLALVAAGIIIIAGVYYFTPSLDDTAGIVKQSAKVVAPKDVAQEKVEKKAEVVKPKRTVAKIVVKRKEPKAKPAPVVKIAKPAPVKVVKEKKVAPKEVAVPLAALEALSPAKLASMNLAPGMHILRANATALTWMRVEIDSKEPFEVMLRTGERAEWKGKVFFYS